MCTTINCEFQNVGKECNETTTAIEVTKQKSKQVNKNTKNQS